jgi:hypothetical protein
MSVPVAVLLPGTEEPLSGHTVNVSATGAAVAVDEEILQAGTVELRFLGPGAIEGMVLRALIRWVRSGRDDRAELGLEFEQVPAEVRDRLQMFLYGEVRVIAPPPKSASSGAFLSP